MAVIWIYTVTELDGFHDSPAWAIYFASACTGACSCGLSLIGMQIERHSRRRWQYVPPLVTLGGITAVSFLSFYASASTW